MGLSYPDHCDTVYVTDYKLDYKENCYTAYQSVCEKTYRQVCHDLIKLVNIA